MDKKKVTTKSQQRAPTGGLHPTSLTLDGSISTHGGMPQAVGARLLSCCSAALAAKAPPGGAVMKKKKKLGVSNTMAAGG